jgi:hypothetical protein
MVSIKNDPKTQGGPQAEPSLSLGNASLSRTVTFQGLNPENLPTSLSPTATLFRTQEEPGREAGRDLNPAAAFTRVIGANGRTVGLTAGEIGVGPESGNTLSLDRSLRLGFPTAQVLTTAPSKLVEPSAGQESRRSTIYDLRGRGAN